MSRTAKRVGTKAAIRKKVQAATRGAVRQAKRKGNR